MVVYLAIVMLAVLAGCAREAPRLQVVARLFPTEAKKHFGDRAECDVDDDIRPALGCARLIGSRPDESGSESASRYRVPRDAAGKPLVVRRLVRPSVEAKWENLEPLLRRSADGTIDVPFPGGAGQREVFVYLVGDGPSEWRSKPVAIPPGAVLEGAVALDTLVPADSRAPIAFEVRVATADGERSLYRTERKADDPGGWYDYRIDLAELAGREASLVLDATTLEGAQGSFEIAAPLWSRPLLVAPTRAKAAERPSFLVISIDTLRADHVGVYGAQRPTTPNLDRLAARGVVFEDASTTYPSTTASHMSLMTGLHPSSHGVYFPGRRLDVRVPTVAQLLAQSGYRTAAVTENGMIGSVAGFQRGFDSYAEVKEGRTFEVPGYVAEVVDRGIALLDRHRDEEFFLFLHTYQVHAPHDPPAAFARFGGGEGSPAERYAGEVLYMDSEIGRLLDAVDASGLDEKTVVLLTADHGEGFGEHGVLGHGHALFEELMRIPLVVWDAGAPARRRVDVPVSLVDVPPTILELAGIEVPPTSQGRSLVALLRGTADEVPERPVFAERRLEDGSVATAVRKGDRKWILGEPLRPDRVFDVASDPKESKNLATPELLAEGRALLDAHVQRAQNLQAELGASVERPRDVDPRTQNALRALGYVESPDGAWAPPPAPAPTGGAGS